MGPSRWQAHLSESSVSARRAVLVFVFALGTAVAVAAQPPVPAGDSPGPAPLSTNEQVSDALAKTWSAFYGGKYDDAISLSEPLTKLSDRRFRWAAVEAAHIRARSMWGKGDAQSRAAARQLWDRLERSSTLDALLVRLKIVQALRLEAADDPARLGRAIGILEQIVRDNPPNTALPEAAIDLGRLYTKAGRFEDAKRTLDFAVSTMGNRRTVDRMEITEALAKAYVDAGKLELARLAYAKDAGRADFEAAEKLEQAARSAPAAARVQKYGEALAAYQAVVEQFPETDYAPRSELAIGRCYLGQGRLELAAEHWKKFIAAKPAGPWRGQAFVALIDVCLEELLDLAESAKYADLVRPTLRAALADEETAESWRPVAYDLQYRIGLANLLRSNGQAAAEAFEQAKTLSRRRRHRHLDLMIAASRGGWPVVPQDVLGRAGLASDKAALALALGVVHLAADRPDSAAALFDRVDGSGDTPMDRLLPGVMPPQRAFAAFGRGAALQTRRRSAAAARDQFAASLRAFPDGTWHDETLYRIATITQHLTDAGHRAARRPAPETPDEEEAAAQAESERLAALLEAREEMLSYWQSLIRHYPDSPRCEHAFYNAGLLLSVMAEDAPAARSEALWRRASAMFGRFRESYPQSPLAGDAIVRQTGIAMEQLLDLALAREAAEQGIAWAGDAEAEAGAPEEGEAESLPLWAMRGRQAPPASPGEVLYVCSVRAGLAAHIEQDYERATLRYKAASEAGSPRRNLPGAPPVGLEEQLLGYAEAAVPLAPADTLRGAREAAVLLSLGDLYYVAGRHGRARAYFDRVGEIAAATPAQRAFATFGQGAVLQAVNRPGDATEQFLASIRAFPAGTWHDESLYRVATIIEDRARNRYGTAARPAEGADDDPARPRPAAEREAADRAERHRRANLVAARARALPHWRGIIERYPESPRAEQALYRIGVIQYELAETGRSPGGRPLPPALQEQAWKDAAATFTRFCEKYPESLYSGGALLLHIDVALERMFDVDLAEKLADQGVRWIEAATEPEIRWPPEVVWAAWQQHPVKPAETAIRSVVYNLRLRGIFSAYLAGNYAKANRLLSSAGPLEPVDGQIDAKQIQRIGLHFLQRAIAAQRPVWNQEVLAKARTDRQRTALKLADLYLRVVRTDNAAAIYERIIDEDPAFAPALPVLEVYARIQLARAYAYDQKFHGRALETLQGLYKPELAGEPQVAEGLVWLGTMTFNFTQDPRKAMPHLEQVMERFPDAPSTERAMYFYALMAVGSEDRARAEAACKRFLATYPDSIWFQHVRALLDRDAKESPPTERSER